MPSWVVHAWMGERYERLVVPNRSEAVAKRSELTSQGWEVKLGMECKARKVGRGHARRGKGCTPALPVHGDMKGMVPKQMRFGDKVEVSAHITHRVWVKLDLSTQDAREQWNSMIGMFSFPRAARNGKPIPVEVFGEPVGRAHPVVTHELCAEPVALANLLSSEFVVEWDHCHTTAIPQIGGGQGAEKRVAHPSRGVKDDMRGTLRSGRKVNRNGMGEVKKQQLGIGSKPKQFVSSRSRVQEFIDRALRTQEHGNGWEVTGKSVQFSNELLMKAVWDVGELYAYLPE